MELATDHDALVDLARRAGDLLAAQEPLPAQVHLVLAGLSPAQCGSDVLSRAVVETGRAWDHALEIYRWDAGRLVDILRTVDARYVATEMALASRFRDVDGGVRGAARLAHDDRPGAQG